MNENKSFKDALTDTLCTSLGAILLEMVESFIGMICWNHLALIFNWTTLHYIDAVAVCVLIHCLCTVIRIEFRKEKKL